MIPFIPNNVLPPSPNITYLSVESLGVVMRTGPGASPASAAWPFANRAYFIPFVLKTPIAVIRLFTANGTTVSGNIDIGIYNLDGTRIISTGSTAQAGTSAIQAVTIASTTIGPGMYYLALAASSATATFAAAAPVSVVRAQMGGLLSQNTALPLPATATFASPASAYYPLFGLSTNTLV